MAPKIADLSKEENHSLTIFSWMRRVDTFLGIGHKHQMFFVVVVTKFLRRR